MALTNDPRQDHYFVLVASGALSLVAGELLGPAALLLMFVDDIDPYQYNQAMSRDGLNELFKQLRQQAADDEAKLQPTALATLRSMHPGLTDDQYARLLAYVQSPYKLWVKWPDSLSACFPYTARPQAPVMGGPPTDACDEGYRTAYYQYVTEHADSQSTDTSVCDQKLNEIATADVIIAQHGTFLKYRDEYLAVVYAAAALLGVALLVLLAWYVVERFNPK